MIPALLLVLAAVVYRVTTGLLIHSGASWLSNFAPLAAIALCSAAYFPKKYKFSVPLLTLFISDAIINFRYGAPLLDPQILVRYAALALVGLARSSFAKSSVAEDAFACIDCRIHAVLSDHEYIFVAERPRLREKFRRTDSISNRRVASIQRDTDLDVLPQFTRSVILFLLVCLWSA